MWEQTGQRKGSMKKKADTEANWGEHLCFKKKLALTMILIFCSSPISRKKELGEGREEERKEGEGSSREKSMKEKRKKGNEMSIY